MGLFFSIQQDPNDCVIIFFLARSITRQRFLRRLMKTFIEATWCAQPALCFLIVSPFFFTSAHIKKISSILNWHMTQPSAPSIWNSAWMPFVWIIEWWFFEAHRGTLWRKSIPFNPLVSPFSFFSILIITLLLSIDNKLFK